jgi:hypothetical protein
VWTEGEIIRGALSALSSFPRIARLVIRGSPEKSISEAVKHSWPELPPALVFHLWLCSLGHTDSREVVDHIERVLKQVESSAAVSGAWRSRARKLMQTGSQQFEGHVALRSALFELQLGYRLGRNGYSVRFVSDKTGGADLIVCDADDRAVCAVEAYAPQKSVREDLEYLQGDWGELVVGASKGPTRDPSAILVSRTAVPDAIRDFVASPNSRRKLEQLGSGDLPTLLAMLAWALTPDGVTSLLPHLFGMDRNEFGPSVYEGLPERCLGVLLCFFDLALDGGTGLEFRVAPGRTMPEEVRKFVGEMGAQVDG